MSKLMIHSFLTILIVSSFWKNGQSENIKGSGNNKIKKNVGDESQIQSVRGYLNKGNRILYNGYSRGIPFSNFGSLKNGAFEDVIRSYKNYDTNGYYNDNRGLFERSGHKFEYDDGNPDIHGEIQRPCQAYDTYCIRKFFAEHSRCKISGRRVPDPLYQAENSVYLTSANITQLYLDALYGGLNNARITEFYINKATDNLVIAITFDAVTRVSTNAYFKYYLSGREPIVNRDFITLQNGVLTVTVIIPQLHDLRLERAEIFTFGDTKLFAFAVGPNFAISTDPAVPIMFAKFTANLPTEYLEQISHEGYIIVGNYIQYNICDFGLKKL